MNDITRADVEHYLQLTGLETGKVIELEYWKGETLHQYSGTVHRIRFAREVKNAESKEDKHFLLTLQTENGFRSFWSDCISGWILIK